MDIEVAISIALHAHKGQCDKGGKPYILHPLAVMNRVETIEEKIVAVLHDVVEDTEVTIEELKKYGFSGEIIEAIRLLTKTEEETYEEFIQRANTNPISRNVKKADLKENLDLSRIKDPTQGDLKRVDKYKKAIEILDSD
ncbi:GTP pyrophosphokinase [Paenibacillus nasutitermitis]|uniref:HD domain-containing protein n=1 Tax=Paenibacillus nasutitermitis TaxID=1652958 RepID=A0A916ZEF7_9BACL|nr:GTP pyrophosphokinase [Paenibacillus nasutitermitis]GGD91066.1 hypothetical protein GCM10010911_57200 [Paenibacillus nasutitermitis]